MLHPPFKLCPGGLQAHLLFVREGGTARSVEGELCHHGEGHALRCLPVLLPRTVQKITGELLRLPGKVSGTFSFSTTELLLYFFYLFKSIGKFTSKIILLSISRVIF